MEINHGKDMKDENRYRDIFEDKYRTEEIDEVTDFNDAIEIWKIYKLLQRMKNK